MERLTFEGNFCDIAMCKENPCPYNNSCTQREVWERLKAYEDTGLTPEGIEELKRGYRYQYESLTFLLCETDCEVSHVKELLTAEKEGRLAVMPCKVGDVLYHTILGEIREKTVISISTLFSQSVSHMTIHVQNARGAVLPVEMWQLGTHVFLTREEAEVALANVTDINVGHKGGS